MAKLLPPDAINDDDLNKKIVKLPTNTVGEDTILAVSPARPILIDNISTDKKSVPPILNADSSNKPTADITMAVNLANTITNNPIEILPENIPVENVPPPIPENTIEATTLSQMYSIAPQIEQVWNYTVGKIPTVVPFLCGFRNNTVNATLRVTIQKPIFVNIDTENIFDVPPLHIVLFTVSLNEYEVKELSKTNIRKYIETFVLNIEPLNITETIFVKTNLQPFDADIATPQSQPGSSYDWYNVTKRIFTTGPTSGSIICPPGIKRFYEPGDPTAIACLRKYELSDTLPFPPKTVP